MLLVAALALTSCSSPAVPISADQVNEWASEHVAFRPGCNGSDCMTAEIVNKQRLQTSEDEAPLWCFTVRYRSGDKVEEGNFEGYRWTYEDTNVKCYRFYNDGSGAYGIEERTPASDS